MRNKTFATICLAVFGAFLMTGCSTPETPSVPYRHQCSDSRKTPLPIFEIYIDKDVSFDTLNPRRDSNGCFYGFGKDEGVKHCGPIWTKQNSNMVFCVPVEDTIAPAGRD